jgi:hypothetical protein
MNILRSTCLLGTAVVLLCAGCGARAGMMRTTNTLRAVSSISDGAALSSALSWTGIAVGVPLHDVDRVEFVIDGRIRWTAHKTPYVFNGVGDELFPWVLGAGAHRLAVLVVTRTGATASTAAAVTVVASEPVPPELLGTFTRRVIGTYVPPTQASRREPADQELPSGIWRIRVAPDGVISVEGPRGSGGNEAFSATPGTLALQGPANWILPRSRQGGFCEVEPIGAYAWSAGPRTLILRSLRDRCAVRNLMFTGTWRRA